MPMACDARRPDAITHTSGRTAVAGSGDVSWDQPLGNRRYLALVKHVHLKDATDLRGSGRGADGVGGSGAGRG